MMDMEMMTAISNIAGNLTTQAVLLAWVFHEIRRANRLEAKLIMNQDIEAAKEA